MRVPGSVIFDTMFSSLDRRDRQLLMGCLAAVAVIIVAIALVAPRQRDESPVPSSYGAGTHGAKAAYLLLARSGYQVERWERPLAELDGAGHPPTDGTTVLVLAGPFYADVEQAKKAVHGATRRWRSLEHGCSLVS